jgi:drug/metabolite transporter (DMT)-like permease
MHHFPYLGESCALLAPAAWSFAVILFRQAGFAIPPIALNAFKNSLGLALYWATIVALGVTAPELAGWRQYSILLGSGVIGMALSDTLFFMSLNRLGAGLQAIVNTSYAPAIIVLSIIFLDERLGLWQWLGVALIASAVVVVAWVKSDPAERTPRVILVGIGLGLAAILLQAVSVIVVKPLLNALTSSTAGDGGAALAALIWATCWRLVGGTVVSWFQCAWSPGARRALLSLGKRHAWPAMIGGSVIGTYFSLLLWMAGFMWADAAVASALNQTVTLFTFVLAALILHEPVTPRRLAGLGLGLAGVGLVTFGG